LNSRHAAHADRLTNTLAEIAHTLTSGADPDASLQRVLQSLQALMPADRGALVELDQTGGQRQIFYPDPAPEERAALTAMLEQLLPVVTAQPRRAVSHTLAPSGPAGLWRAYLAVPLHALGCVRGLLFIARTSGEYEARDLDILSVVAAQVALYLMVLRPGGGADPGSEAHAAAGHEPGQRFAFLAAAGEALAESLDYEETLRRIARLAVPEMADWCVTLDEFGAIRLLAVAHVDPAREATVRELRARYPFDPEARYGLPKVLRSGQAEVYPRIDVSWRRAAARDDEHLRLMELLDARSSMCVPLRARGRVLGAMTFVRAKSRRPYGARDLELAGELARRCGLALDNARLYSQLQQTLADREAFVASLVHDLKNPLTAALGHAQLLKRLGATSVPPNVAPRLTEGATKIEANAIKMRRLLDGLLDLTRLEADQPLQLVCAPVDLVQLSRQAAAEYQRSAAPRLEVETWAQQTP
jgi:GAF domain-containing protein